MTLPLPDLAGAEWIVLGILFLSTAVRCTLGFGDALIAMPLLATVVGLEISVPLVALCSLTSATIVVATAWRDTDWSVVRRLFLGAVVGIPIGAHALTALPEVWMVRGLGVVLVLFAAYALLRPELPAIEDDRAATPFGFLAGALGGAYNTGGPPLLILGSCRPDWDPIRFRASLMGYFLPANLLICLIHTANGLMTGDVLGLYLGALPLVLLAVALGSWLNGRIPNGPSFRRGLQGIIGLLGVWLLVRAGAGPAVGDRDRPQPTKVHVVDQDVRDDGGNQRVGGEDKAAEQQPHEKGEDRPGPERTDEGRVNQAEDQGGGKKPEHP